MCFYIKDSKMNQDEYDQLLKDDLVNKDIIHEIDKWLELKEGPVKNVDFFDPMVNLEDYSSEESEASSFQSRNQNYEHMKYGLLEKIDAKKIVRPHLFVKSHSSNFDVRGKKKSNIGKDSKTKD